MSLDTPLKLGSRGSQLALYQAHTVARMIEATGAARPDVVIIRTSGDRLQEAPLSEIGGKRLFVKGGAEGVICAALPELGLGIAIKADDGAGRATEPLLSAVLDALLPMDERERAIVAAWRTRVITSRTGLPVGKIRPVEGLAAALKG